MKTGTKFLLAMTMVLCLNIASDLRAHDLIPPPYRGLPATVMAEFEFAIENNPASPTGGNWVPGPDGEPLNDFVPGIEFDNFTWNQQAGGSWTANQGEPSTMTINMPNIEDDFPVKYIRVQITWRYEGQSGPPQFDGIIGMDAEDGPLTGVSVFNSGTTGIGGNMRQSFYDIRVRPNPDWEIIRFGVPAGMSIRQVVVDTISVPEEQDAHAATVQAIGSTLASGTLEDTFSSDDSYLVVEKDFSGPTALPGMALVFSSYWQPDQGATFVGMAVTIESRVTITGVQQHVALWNWTKSKYDLIASGPATLSDAVTEVVVLNSDYVEPITGEVKTQVRWRVTPGLSSLNFNVVLDWINWKYEMGFYDE